MYMYIVYWFFVFLVDGDVGTEDTDDLKLSLCE